MVSAFTRMHLRLFRHFGAVGFLTHADASVSSPFQVVIKKDQKEIDAYDNVIYRNTIAEFISSEIPAATSGGDILTVTEGDYAGDYKLGVETYNNGHIVAREVVFRP